MTSNTNQLEALRQPTQFVRGGKFVKVTATNPIWLREQIKGAEGAYKAALKERFKQVVTNSICPTCTFISKPTEARPDFVTHPDTIRVHIGWKDQAISVYVADVGNLKAQAKEAERGCTKALAALLPQVGSKPAGGSDAKG